MSSPDANRTLPVGEALQVDAICAEFENCWRDGEPPRIEDYLDRLDRSVRPVALRQLIAKDLRERRRRGESVVVADYMDRFPEFDAAAFDTQSPQDTVGQAPREPEGGLSVRCPLCQCPVKLAPDAELESIRCSSCGGDFGLTREDDQATRDARGIVQVGHFMLIERLGMGAFGAVWKAQDIDLDRTVAVKIPRSGQLDKKRQDLFFREARAAAQLRHPNIVPVYEVGRDGDTIYIVSEFVRGVTLSDRLTLGPLDARQATDLCAKVADALHHAHEKGVIHRDLKPANVMIDAVGEPHLMDFGLARREAGEVTMTLDGQVLGTPAYMSPEQAQGDAHAADRRSDVYSLGVILFELLTGSLPFQGNVRMLIHQVLNDEPPSPRALNPKVPKDLETITLKCLEKAPQRRFASAHELAIELRRVLANAPILSRPISALERVSRWSRRKPAAAGLLAAIGGLATLAVIMLMPEPTREPALAGGKPAGGESPPVVAPEQARVEKPLAQAPPKSAAPVRKASESTPSGPPAETVKVPPSEPPKVSPAPPAKEKISLELASLLCERPNDIDGMDQVVLNLVVDGRPMSVAYADNYQGTPCTHMKAGDEWPLAVPLTFEDQVVVTVRELGGVPGQIGKIVIRPETIAQKTFDYDMFSSGMGKHVYKLKWRLAEPTK